LKIDKKLINEFLLDRENREITRSTNTNYYALLKNVMAFTQGKELDKKLLTDFKTEMLERHRETTVQQHIIILNSFLTFHGRPDLKLKKLKLQKTNVLDSLLSDTEIQRLTSSAKKSNDKRIYPILIVLLTTGMRVSELRHLTMESLESSSMHFRSKGKFRSLPLPGHLATYLLRYAKKQGIKSGPVFLGIHGAPITPRIVRRMLHKTATAARISHARVHPHALRHYFATKYMTERGNISELQAILGHSSINTTQIYTKPSSETLRSNLEQIGKVLIPTKTHKKKREPI